MNHGLLDSLACDANLGAIITQLQKEPESAPCSDSLSLRLPYAVKLATERKSLTHYTKGTPSRLASSALRLKQGR